MLMFKQILWMEMSLRKFYKNGIGNLIREDKGIQNNFLFLSNMKN